MARGSVVPFWTLHRTLEARSGRYAIPSSRCDSPREPVKPAARPKFRRGAAARAGEQPTEIESADDARPIFGGQPLPDDRSGAGGVLSNDQWSFEDLRGRCCGSGFKVEVTLSTSARLSEKISLAIQIHQSIRCSARPYVINGRQGGRRHSTAKRDDGVQSAPFGFLSGRRLDDLPVGWNARERDRAAIHVLAPCNGRSLQHPGLKC